MTVLAFFTHLLCAMLPLLCSAVHASFTEEKLSSNVELFIFLGVVLHLYLFSFASLSQIFFEIEPRQLRKKHLLVCNGILIALMALQHFGLSLLIQGIFQTGGIIIVVSQLLLAFVSLFVAFCSPLPGPNLQKECNRAAFPLYYVIFFAWMVTASIYTPTYRSVLTGLSFFFLIPIFQNMQNIELNNDADGPSAAVLCHMTLTQVLFSVFLFSIMDKVNFVWFAHYLYNLFIGIFCIDSNLLFLEDLRIADGPLIQLRRVAAERRTASTGSTSETSVV